MKKYLIVLVLVLIIAGVGVVYWGLNKNKTEIVAPNLFTNLEGQYSFETPTIWKASVNKYNSKNSLFGPDADSGSGLGGVEVFAGFSSIDNFLGSSEAQVTQKTEITLAGVTGVRAHYQSAPTRSGEQVVLFKDGNIYNIYLNSVGEQDFQIFEQIVASFKFAN